MKHTTFRIKPGISLFACAACALGLLLWARLLLVSHAPRIATAEPVPGAPAAPKPAPAKSPEGSDRAGPAVKDADGHERDADRAE